MAKKSRAAAAGDDSGKPSPSSPKFDQKSPIDLKDSFYHQFDVGQVQFYYPSTKVKAVREGSDPHHMIYKVSDEVHIPLFGMTLKLHELHFHAKSEHQTNGFSWPLELHIVHKIESGQSGPTVGSDLLAMGVFYFPSTEDHPELVNPHNDSFFRAARKSYSLAENKIADTITFDPNPCLPILGERHRFYRYEGSLTSGVLEERVSWLVFERPVPILSADIAPVLAHATQTQQKIQPLNRRIVLRSFP